MKAILLIVELRRGQHYRLVFVASTLMHREGWGEETGARSTGTAQRGWSSRSTHKKGSKSLPKPSKLKDIRDWTLDAMLEHMRQPGNIYVDHRFPVWHCEAPLRPHMELMMAVILQRIQGPCGAASILPRSRIHAFIRNQPSGLIMVSSNAIIAHLVEQLGRFYKFQSNAYEAFIRKHGKSLYGHPGPVTDRLKCERIFPAQRIRWSN